MSDASQLGLLGDKTDRKISLAQLAKNIGAQVFNLEDEVPISGFATLETAGESDISFVTAKRLIKSAEKSRAAAFLAPQGVVVSSRPTLCVENVWEAILTTLNYFYKPQTFPEKVDPTARIGKDVKIGEKTFIGAYCIVGDDAKIGSNCAIRDYCYIGASAEIGDDSVLFPRVSVLDRVKVGKRVILHTGVVLGSDGYKYEIIRGKRVKIPQIGTVIVEDDVEIGANTCVDRASFAETRIGAGTKIDNLVHIAHNVKIGRNCLVVAQVGIAGSTSLGDNCMLGGQAGLKDNIKLGNNVIIGAQSGVHEDLPDGSFYFSSPAMPMQLFRRCWVHFKHLPEMHKAIKTLMEKMEKDRSP
jgi:UDP-3-O-[3-hydroxymyristoyl] glucosamine N-acyltransferase